MKKIPYILFLLLIFSFSAYSQLGKRSEIKISSPATAVKNSPDGRMAIGTYSGDIYLCNAITLGVDNTFSGQIGPVHQLAFSPDGAILASCGEKGEVYVWDVKKGSYKYHLSEHKSTVESISVNFNGTLLATGDEDGKIIIWNLSDGSIAQTYLDHNKSIGELEFAHRSNLLACSDLEGIIEIYNIDKKEVVRKMTTDSKRINTIAWSPTDKFIASGGDDKEIKVWDVDLGYSSLRLTGHKKSIEHIAYSPDGAYLFSVSMLENSVKVWDLKTAQEISNQSGFYKIMDCHVSYDGQRLVTADYDASVEFFDISNLKIRKDNDLNQFKNLFVSGSLVNDPPKIQIINPVITKDNEKYLTQDALFDVKGKVESSAGLFLLLVNGQETKVDENGFFTARLELEFAHNKISVKAIDVLKQVTEKNFVLTRPMYSDLVDKSNIKRKGKDYALVVGTDEFVNMNNLNNPVNDVKTIAKELRNRYGFITDSLINPTKNEIYGKIREYSEKEFSDEDQLFIFIAGHGEYDPVFREGYIVCKDSDSKTKDIGRSTFISHSNLNTLINNIDCKHICLILDVCFGGSFEAVVANRGSEMQDTTGKNEFIRRKMDYKTRLFVTSGGTEYVPDGRPGHHSPFTRQFLLSLRSDGGTDGILTMTEVKTYLETLTPTPRFGQFGSNEPGSDFLFITK